MQNLDTKCNNYTNKFQGKRYLSYVLALICERFSNLTETANEITIALENSKMPTGILYSRVKIDNSIMRLVFHLALMVLMKYIVNNTIMR